METNSFCNGGLDFTANFEDIGVRAGRSLSGRRESQAWMVGGAVS